MSTKADLRELAIDRGGMGPSALPARRRLMTRYVLPLVLVAGFLSLIGWASRDVVFPPQSVMVVPVLSTTREVRQEGTPLFKAAGWIEPRPTPVRVAALASGVVEKLLVVEDQPVEKNEPIAELVKADARLEHRRSLANMKLREAEWEQAKAECKAAETRLKQPVHLEAALAEAEASLAKIETEARNLPFEIRRAEADKRAAQNIYDGKAAAKGVVAGVEIDIARSKLDSARALLEELRRREDSLQREREALASRRNALQTQLELLTNEIKAHESAQANLKSAMARVEQARIAVAEAELQLDRMTVRSPIDGRVFRLIADPGTRLSTGMGQASGSDGSTVVTLYRPEMLQVGVDVRFEDLPKITLQQPVRIENAALPAPTSGEVLFIGSEADIQKNTLQVKVAIENPPSVLKPEMLVDVTFLAPQQDNERVEPSQELRLYLPEPLIHRDEAGPFVWLADQSEGVARKTSVEIGPRGNNGLVEITSGLTTSHRVVSTGFQNLADGARIRVAGEDSSFGAHGTVQGGDSPVSERPARGGER